MSTPILTTKLYVPPVRMELVPRPGLIERLNAGLHRRLTLVSAPAGFGKTTLLSAWAAGCDRPVAWVSLDEGDNDPVRFWAHLIAALQTIHQDVGETAMAALRSPQRPPIEPLLTGLINEIARVRGSFVLILDDLHVVTNQAVNDALSFFLDNMPPQMHLILAGRADPPWPLARRRARGEMTELRVRDLRFTLPEAAAFLNEVMKLGLSPEDVDALEQRTEGWIAGLQMAALSMQGRQDVSGFIAAFTGTHRFILDYLVEEVLDAQPGDIQDFLLRTSVLERMTPPLCDALTERDDSQVILTRLEQANLFLVPLDDERRWYRYHHLFVDLLHGHLEQTRPDQVPILHRRASEWYEKNGLLPEALSHALAAGDIELATLLIEGNTLALLDRGELATLVSWLDSLPREVLDTRPWLCVAYAWVMLYTGQLDAVELFLQKAEQALSGFEAPAQARHIGGHIAAILAYLTNIRGDKSDATEIARQALQRLPEGDMMARGFATGTLATALRYTGDLAGAAQAYADAIAIGHSVSASHVGVDFTCDLAILQMMRGQLHKAAATFQSVMQRAEKGLVQAGALLPYAWYAYTGMSSVLREWNDLEEAIRYATVGLEAAEEYGNPILMKLCYPELAKVLQAAGDSDGALDAIEKAKDASRDLSPWLYGLATTDDALLRLRQGDIAAASRWAQKEGLSVHDEIGFQYEFWYRTLARLLVVQGRPDEALGLSARLLELYEATGATGYAIEILVLQAMALQAHGKIDGALAPLERALALAEPEGYVRTFIDEGQPMGVLLREAAARGIALDYVSRLLAALECEVEDVRRPAELVEPLSEREQEVLRLLVTHLSGPEIAQQLFISVHTVRSHIKSIYGKLNAHSRKDAIQRAQELGLF